MRVGRRQRRFTACAIAALLGAALGGCGPGDPVAAVRELHAQGRFAESIEPLQELVEARPDDAEVHYLYGLALARTRQVGLAPFALRKAMETPEWLVPAGLTLAAVELESANAEAAVEAVDRVLGADPDHLDALVLRGRAQATSRQSYDRVLADADRALELDPGNVDGLMLRAVALLGLERIEEAEEAIATLEQQTRDAELDPALADRYCAMRALFYAEKGVADEADRTFGECLAVAPASAEVVQEAILFYDAQRRPERAIEILRAALEELPAGGYRRVLAERLRQAGDPAAAEQVLREGTELDSPALAIEAWVDLSNHFHAVDDHAAAAVALEHAIEVLGEPDAELLFNYADALVMAERFDEAREVARGLALDVHRHLIEGRVALEEGRPEDALERFDEALPQWPDNAVLRYYAALAAERAGHFERAISEYRYSIRAGKQATDARLRLARLHAAAEDPNAALAVVRHDLGGEGPGALEADLIGIRLLARHGRTSEAKEMVAGVVASRGELGAVVAAIADGERERAGPEEGVRTILTAEGLDLTDPANAPALRALVGLLGEAGRPAEALEAAEGAVAKHPDAAAFHEIRCAALAATGAGREEIRAACDRALELDPRSTRSLEALARLEADAGDPAAALARYARAAELDSESTSALRASAELLAAEGRGSEAEAQLALLLRRDPYDGASAARLLELRLGRGDGDLDRALALGRQAVHFGGGPAAYALLATVFELRGEPELARAAAARAQPPPAPGDSPSEG